MAGTQRQSSTSAELEGQVQAVGRIRLEGAPETLVVHPWALLAPEGEIPPSLAAKLQVLTQHEGMRLVLLSAPDDAVQEALGNIPHSRVTTVEEAQLHGPALAILTEKSPLPPNVYGWYAGQGDAPAPLHPTRSIGAQATDEILGLFGTALLQERAGIAFRAAGAGKEVPRDARFDPKILDGIAGAVTNHPDRVDQLEHRYSDEDMQDLEQQTDRLIAAALPPILKSQDKGGALAAAPPPHGPDEPNYWFFWQRDAGQAVIALAPFARESANGRLRDSVHTLLDRYLQFVERLPQQHGIAVADLGVSRFEMDGRPIQSYGNPQKDGPAQTVLAVVAVLGETARAYEVSKPYLEYLDRFIFGPAFDPWEFAVGEIFFTYNLARKALRTGSRLARVGKDEVAAHRYAVQAGELERTLLGFMNYGEAHLDAGRCFLQPFLGATSHLDIDVVGSILTAYDVSDPFLNLEDPSVYGTMRDLERVYAGRWPVNIAWRKRGNAGMGMGRFPEDVNDGIGSTGGNPWTFATLWAAQFYLRLIQRRDFLGGGITGAPHRSELLEKAEGYLQFVLRHLPAEALTEQIDGQKGTPRGAPKLTWAQAALIQTLILRRDVLRGPRR